MNKIKVPYVQGEENAFNDVINQPLISTPMSLESELRTYSIRRRISLIENPFLLDHVIANYPVLPATCALSWMINACEALYPGYRCSIARDFKVLKGVIFNDTLANEYILELQEVSKSHFESIEFKATILSINTEEKISYHFRASLKIMREIPVIPIYESVNLAEDNIMTTSKDFYQNGDLSLFHGSAFQKITRVLNISPEKITVECLWQEITAEQQGQFPIKWYNPYTADLSTHALWIWLSHLHQKVCLPVQLGQSEQFAITPHDEPFYVSCEIRQKTKSSVTANYITHNRQGQVYTRVLGAKAIVLSRQLLKHK
ncbi:hypothetical protein A6770_15855 [Nostoc minutum NIES-26]|uniref:PKS/mFAS DH domain-containing protein n=1 Tax=Nostoc minutum NIES-26 TaxID=1844469 RepID=A0A367RIV8_9NOSO|nr:hypothetical protein A6770_15855 [Nostoc minutum NIES-26]